MTNGCLLRPGLHKKLSKSMVDHAYQRFRVWTK
jgi:hypothetical protein